MFWKTSKNKKSMLDDYIGLKITGDITSNNTFSFLVPISKAIICFCLVYGVLCGYADCFMAEFNTSLIFIVLLALSLVIAYLHYIKNYFVRNFSFIFIFIIFIYFISKDFKLVNSGYHALVNMTYASLENYLSIPALVYYEEIIENSYSTITAFILFVGFFLLMLFHMWIEDRIHLLSIYIVSFLPILVPFYLNFYPDNLYSFFILFGSISLLLLLLSGHAVKHKNHTDDDFIVSNIKINNTPSRLLFYKASSVNYFSTMIVAAAFSACVLFAVNVTVPFNDFQMSHTESKLKDSTSEKVKYFVTFGLSGYFNRYNAKGGLAEGKLGGIYEVRPDYETDLIVTYQPTDDVLYLRGYVGVGYTERKWLSYRELIDNNLVSPIMFNVFSNDTMLAFEYDSLDGESRSLIIENVNSNPFYVLHPYYSDSKDIAGSRFFSENGTLFSTNTINYKLASLSQSEYNKDESYLFSDSNMIYSYLQMPASTRNEVIKFIKDNNLNPELIVGNNTYSNLSGESLDKVINSVSDVLTNDFTYSLNPGITSGKVNFIGDFLNESKKGYCAYFASAAAMIFRAYGIPSRYVEGYVVLLPEISDDNITVVDDSTNTIKVNVSDEHAHAWVEYYDPESGWKVFEATTARTNDFSNASFFSNLYRLISDSTRNEVTNDSNLLSDNRFTLFSKTILGVIAFIFFVFIFFILMYFSYNYVLIYRSYHRIRNSINLRNYYKIIVKKICKKYPEFAYIVSLKDQFDFIINHYELPDSINTSKLNKLIDLLEKAQFSNVELSLYEFKFSFRILKCIRYARRKRQRIN